MYFITLIPSVVARASTIQAMTNQECSHEAGSASTATLCRLPAELLDIILAFIPQIGDLSRLSRTCWFLKYQLTPQLFGHLRLKVPLRPCRLLSLEQLVKLCPDGLRHTIRISVTPSQSLVPEVSSGRKIEEKDIDNDGIKYLPNEQQSSNINTLISLLIQKIPDSQIISFKWENLLQLKRRR